jgi:hypothetical protein
MMIDSLDALIIMGLDQEYEMCRKWIVENLDFSAAKVRRSFISRA